MTIVKEEDELDLGELNKKRWSWYHWAGLIVLVIVVIWIVIAALN